MEIDTVMESLKFMVLGMGVVFSFLIILIFVLKGQSKFLSKYFPEKEEKIAHKMQSSSASNKNAKIAAVVAAVQHHNNFKG